MKRIVLIIIALMYLLSLTACSNNTTGTSANGELCDYVMFTDKTTVLRNDKNSESEIVSQIEDNTELIVIEKYNDGWVKVACQGKSGYVLENNLTFEPKITTTTTIITTELTTTTETIIETTSEIPETTEEIITSKSDYSAEINSLNANIDALKTQILTYKTTIKQFELILQECDIYISENEDLLKKAKIDLDNAYKMKISIYREGQGFVQVVDEGAVNDAQSYVDFYNNIIEDYKIQKKSTQLDIDYYNELLNSANSKLDMYMAELKNY